ncbi:MAG: DUF853 domain-containing protein [Lachnospiraceae bacterium]|nr:DUF853 domain-containing protein [Lachnospiraceae bacterium]
MFFDDKIWMAKNENPIYLLPKMANRHGLVTGATGTGKTITIKVMAETFADAGVSVFLSDIKGDLTGMSQPGIDSEDMQKRIAKFGLDEAGFQYKGYPTTYWDVFGKKGVPVRTTISEMGPMLLSRLMGLSDVQEGVLSIIFKIADDQGLLILDLKDLRAVVQAVGDHANDYKTSYGNITTASIGAIQRGLLQLETQGADKFFGEPGLDIMDWIRTDENGVGMINVLNCEQLFQQPDLYAAFLLWMLSELYERLPEVGDPDKPKIVFFFDEAHLLFKIDSKELMNKVEQVVKLVRSKGVGVYFISQSPTDIPDVVLSQLGNKIQHALRAYTPADQKAVRAAAMSFVVNPEFKTEEVITQLGTGEALVSFLDEKGAPSMVQNAKILPPQSQMGTIEDELLQSLIASSDMYAKYYQAVDRESAYELLTGKVAGAPQPAAAPQPAVTPQPAPLEGPWDCGCGQLGNTGLFCQHCGKPRNQGYAPGTAPIAAAAVTTATVAEGPSLVQAAQAEREAALAAQQQAAEPSLAAAEAAEREAEAEPKLTKEELAQIRKEEREKLKEEERKRKEREKAKKEAGKVASSILTSAGKTAANKLLRGLIENLVT